MVTVHPETKKIFRPYAIPILRAYLVIRIMGSANTGIIVVVVAAAATAVTICDYP